MITAVEVVEEISRADASTGWAYMANIFGSAIFFAHLGDGAVEEMYSGDRLPVVAGMVLPNSVANRVPGGYIVSGKFGFASGAGQGTHFSGGATVEDGSGGVPEVIAYLAPRERVNILGNWDVLGLRATASYDYEIPEQFVGEDYTFKFDRLLTKARRGQPSLRLGLRAVSIAGHGGVALGSAKRALEEIVKVTDAGKQRRNVPPIREQQLFLHDFALHDAKYRSARAYMLEALSTALDSVTARGEPTDEDVQRICQSVTYAVRIASEVVQFSYVWSGSAGLRNPHPLGRLLRDMFGQTQHILVDANVMAGAGPSLMSSYRSEPART